MSFLKKLWHFIWHEDSIASWIVNIILAIIIVKFIFYPVLGFFLGTSFPIVAVVSESMEHNLNFENWWSSNNQFYESLNITKEEFLTYRFKNGFNKGDIIILTGAKDIKRGDVLVYLSSQHSNPIIHRAVIINDKISTKGDNVAGIQEFEKNISRNSIVGRGLVKIPLLGYIKLIFTSIIGGLKNVILS